MGAAIHLRFDRAPPGRWRRHCQQWLLPSFNGLLGSDPQDVSMTGKLFNHAGMARWGQLESERFRG